MDWQEISSFVIGTRKQCGFTQDDLARNAGVSKRTIERIENGFNHDVGFLKVTRVLEALKYTWDVRPNRILTLEELQDHGY